MLHEKVDICRWPQKRFIRDRIKNHIPKKQKASLNRSWLKTVIHHSAGGKKKTRPTFSAPRSCDLSAGPVRAECRLLKVMTSQNEEVYSNKNHQTPRSTYLYHQTGRKRQTKWMPFVDSRAPEYSCKLCIALPCWRKTQWPSLLNIKEGRLNPLSFAKTKSKQKTRVLWLNPIQAGAMVFVLWGHCTSRSGCGAPMKDKGTGIAPAEQDEKLLEQRVSVYRNGNKLK